VSVAHQRFTRIDGEWRRVDAHGALGLGTDFMRLF